MNTLKIPCETGEVSDGFHTFRELYDHRCSLFLALMKTLPSLAWASKLHDDGSALNGWFIAGIHLSTGDVAYHLPEDMWFLAKSTGGEILEKAPKWDGHSSDDTLRRLKTWIPMNTESVDCRKVDFGGMEKVGDFSFDSEFSHIYIWLPGISGPDAIQIQRGDAGGNRVWGWDGNEAKPTLTPSIHAPGQWHGHLIAGRLVSC